MKSRYLHPSNVAFLDLLWNALIGFIALFILAFIQIRPADEERRVETEGLFLLTFRWADGLPDDVDAYVLDPGGNLAFFRAREVGLMHLERDDLGGKNDTISTKQGEVKVESNEERVIIRGIIPGEYVVNTHMYRKVGNQPVTVAIALTKLKGVDTIVVKNEVTLSRDGDEATAFRFTLTAEGEAVDINYLSRRLAINNYQSSQGG